MRRVLKYAGAMSLTAIAPGAPHAYRAQREMGLWRRVVLWVAIAGVHAAVLGALLLAGVKAEPPIPERTVMVTLITEALSASVAPERPASPPEALPPVPPPATPTMVATSGPTASPMAAPPIVETPPAPAAPPAPVAPSAGSPGPAITPPNFTAAYLNNPGPQYPIESRRKREQGIVRLKVHVSADGVADQVQVERTSGFPNLDQAAVDVVQKRWRFAPAKQGDRAVAAWVLVPMSFELKNR